MQILLNDLNEIIAYATVGGIEGSIYTEEIPENFDNTFRPSKFKYIEGKIILNADYVEEIVIN